MIVGIGDSIDGLAVDTNAGGRICSLVLDGRERIITRPVAGIEPSIAWGCFLMAPFVGRLRDGIVTWTGRTARLRLNDGPHSIHGAVFDAGWTVAEKTDDSIKMTCDFDDPSRWPFGGSMTQTIRIARGRLTLEAEVKAREPMPAALGWHPWFVNAGGPLRVCVPSDSVLGRLPDLIPTGELVPVDDRTDLRSGPCVASHDLDHVYAAVRSPVTIGWADLDLTMSFELPVGAVVVCTRPEATAVEPMTAWPDAIRLAAAGHTDTGLVSLAAGERLVAATHWTWSRPR